MNRANCGMYSGQQLYRSSPNSKNLRCSLAADITVPSRLLFVERSEMSLDIDHRVKEYTEDGAQLSYKYVRYGQYASSCISAQY